MQYYLQRTEVIGTEDGETVGPFATPGDAADYARTHGAGQALTLQAAQPQPGMVLCPVCGLAVWPEEVGSAHGACPGADA